MPPQSRRGMFICTVFVSRAPMVLAEEPHAQFREPLTVRPNDAVFAREGKQLGRQEQPSWRIQAPRTGRLPQQAAAARVEAVGGAKLKEQRSGSVSTRLALPQP